MASHQNGVSHVNGQLSTNNNGYIGDFNNQNKEPLIFFVNGKKIIEYNPDPECTLLTYLRDNLRLCGTKLGCGEGGCGACTVMISKVIDRKEKKIKHMSVNACLTPVCSCHGLAITTIDGIGSTITKLHPVQERIAKAHGSQCGFCTPGIVMSMYALLRNMPIPTMHDMEIAFQGNLCRCTGYRPIIDGYRTFTQEYKCAMGDKCCKVIGNGTENGNQTHNKPTEEVLFEPNEFIPYDASQEPIFPPELMLSDKLDVKSIRFYGERVTWHRPATLLELLNIKNQFPDAKIIVGNTEVGVEVKFKHCLYTVLVLPTQIQELNKIEVTEKGIVFGASVTLSDMENTLNMQIKLLPETETRMYKAIVDMLNWFAGKQIRNVASIGGNIMTGSPISDLIPIFAAGEVEMEVASAKSGKRFIKMNPNFFTGYRKNIIKPDEVLVSIKVPRTSLNQHFIAYKQAKRRDDDIAIVNIAVNVHFKPNTDIVSDIQMAYGGMAPTVVIPIKTAKKIIGMRWNNKLIEVANQELIKEIPLDASAPGGMILYRRSLTLSLFFKSYLEISQSLEKYIFGRQTVPDRERSGAKVFHTLMPNGCQLFERVPDTQAPGDPVGKPFVHVSALKQATGEAVYGDDMPKFENELYLALVLSKKAHAHLISVDASAAIKVPGVHAFFSSKDLSEKENVFHGDEEVFASKKVTTQGQVIGAIVADNQQIAQRAARMVNVEYDDIKPIIVTIEDAIEKQSYYPGFPQVIVNGNVDEAIENAAIIVEGEFHMGGQEHFYLETNNTIAVPRDPGELEVFCSTQNPTQVQQHIANCTSIPESRVAVRVKRVGGGFGGKETRASVVAIPVSIAANRLRRPVRCMLDRDEDMCCTGYRHPFYFKYKASATNEGKLTGCEIEIYNNGGFTLDVSDGVLLRAMLSIANSYDIPNVRVSGWVCKTNLPTNTAYRAFGTPQAIMAGEHIVRDVARKLNKDVIEVMQLNLFNEGGSTFYKQKLSDGNLKRCFSECLQQSEYYAKAAEIEKFNKEHRWRKRGISMVPVTYGVGFYPHFMNQAGALLHVYTDGSVLLNHAGIEMGQGLHTKMIQVASRALNVPLERIHITESATDKVPNTTETAASVGSDLNGMAVLHACEQIMARLAPYREKYPNEEWNDWISKAYFDRVSLSAAGFYSTPHLTWDSDTNTGNIFNYFTYGVACSEVEIDCLTGDHQVIRTDIVMDLGASLNPAIDIGQIEGAFIQGYGLYTLEELIYSPTGTLYSKGPGMYKLPGFSDIPATFNVSLLKGSTNPRAVFSSKAVGEPPLVLASSVFFAIREAITAARRENNLDGNFVLLSPASAARIRMACEDKFTEKFKLPEEGSFTPWDVMP